MRENLRSGCLSNVEVLLIGVNGSSERGGGPVFAGEFIENSADRRLYFLVVNAATAWRPTRTMASARRSGQSLCSLLSSLLLGGEGSLGSILLRFCSSAGANMATQEGRRERKRVTSGGHTLGDPFLGNRELVEG